MSYTAQISQKHPSCIIFLIDQSGSMDEKMSGATNKSKAQGVADAVNRLLNDLLDKCTKGSNEPPRDYFDIAVIGYGESVGSAFGGSLAGRTLVKTGEIADNPLRQETVTDDNGQAAKVGLWFEPKATGGTPMCEAIRMAKDLLAAWLPSHQDSYPPIVINITDGDSTDGVPVPEADDLRKLSTKDGNILMFNCDISASAGAKVLFPDSDAKLPDVAHERNLFQMSSELPAEMLKMAQEIPGVRSGARGFAFQASFAELVNFLDIGTKVNLKR